MLKIGDFAGLTGLSVKALRHYDEKLVLLPEEVDSRTGYRLYAEGQVRAGVVIRALRAAGVPLQSVRPVGSELSAIESLEAHREQVLADRLKEDHAYATAQSELLALAAPVHIESRARQEQLFVGRRLPVAVEHAAELSDDEANDVFAELYERLTRLGVQLSGHFWTAIRAGETGEVELLGCWEVLSLPAPHLLGDGDIAGALPARTDLVATWRPTAGEELPEGATHPAIVALFDELGARQLESHDNYTEVRQTVLGHSESDFAVEVSLSLPAE